MADPGEGDQLRADLRTAWHRYVDLTAGFRPALHALCRRLTGNVWDAEDLVQDTLLRAFGQWGVSYGQVRDPRAYLLRTATNVWIDAVRRRDTEARTARAAAAEEGGAALPSETAGDTGAAAARLLQLLSPQERAAVVLKEAFDMPLGEIADLLATTTGAVKAALHRGRARLDAAPADASRRPVPSVALVDRFVDLCRREDVPGLVALMLDGGSADNPGNSFHVGPDAAEGFPRFLHAVVYGHAEWPAALQPESERLERVVFAGEPIVLAFRTYRGRAEALTSLFRIEECQGRIARIRSYAFCPETMRAVGEMLGVRVLTGLYRAPTPAPGEDWPAAPS